MEDMSPELLEILNAPGMTWKVRRALLRHKYGWGDATLDAVLPPPPEGMEFHPGDY